ncbi:MAG: metallophosphoesterase [Deltaproteobacteria bacterium]|nr:metallophosphoesterase [Deltaproteobacteria bacterium]
MTRHTVALGVDAPKRVSQLTDFHVGWSSSDRCLREAIAAAGDARPDLTVLTGDYVNVSLRHLARLEALLELIPRPAVAVLGNHDYWSGPEAIQRSLERAGIAVLRNERLSVAGLEVIGVDDGRTGRDDPDRAFRAVSNPERALVLAHFPPSVSRIGRLGGRLVLSGHTHGGQVHVPRVTPAVAKLTGHELLRGWYEVDQARVYVNAGIGHDRLRIGRPAAPEVAIFDLVPRLSQSSLVG